MEYLPKIDLTSALGGLSQVLEKCGVSEPVKVWIVGEASGCLFCENLFDFVHLTTELKYEVFFKDALKSAKLDSLKEERDLNKQVARVRRAWKQGHRH